MQTKSIAMTIALLVAIASVAAQQAPAQQQPAPAQQQPQPQQQQQQEGQGRGAGRGGRGGEQPGGAGQGQGRGEGRGEGRGAAPAPRALVPVAASTLANTPDKYIGEYVTMTGTVEQNLGKLAFSVDQDKTKSTGKEILVIPVRMSDPIEVNTYVTVIGDVITFDPAEVAKRNKTLPPDLTPDLIAKYQGKPAILATAVINSAMVDLAKFIPPPMTPEEAAFDKTMKAVGPANAAVRKGLEGSNAELVKTNTEVLKKSFVDVEAFWKARGKGDAVKFAQEARKAAELIELAAAAGKWEDVKTHVNTLGQQCAGCHGVYRERGEDGSFYIKPGSQGSR
jgi:cytochrome c556